MSYVSQNPDSSLGKHFSLSQRYRLIQDMIVDYAIGLAILGLNPFGSLLTATLIVAAAILIKMIWDIAKRWHFPVVRNPITIGGGMMNVLGALAIALLAWLTFIFLGALVPLIDRFALSAALMAGTWTLGAAANQFFLDGFLKQASVQNHDQNND